MLGIALNPGAFKIVHSGLNPLISLSLGLKTYCKQIDYSMHIH